MEADKMSRKELRELDYFRPDKDFNSVVIVPNGETHDSGYECMDFILCDGCEIVGKVGGYSDVVHINGIGGYGDWRKGYKDLIKPVAWSIDCLPKNHLLRIFGPHKLSLPDFIGSSFEIYKKD